jgi:hypothetical protein
MGGADAVASIDPDQWAYIGTAIMLAVFALGALVGLKL